MSSTPLRPPASDPLSESRGALPRWSQRFDEPDVVDRAWVDFVATIDADRPRGDVYRALAFARARHGTQTRRGSTTPYWVHLVRVAMTLAEWGQSDPILLQAALLHDTVEDTPTSLREIEVGFGPRVADLVDWLTAPEEPREERRYYARLHAAAPPHARVLKVADRVDNLRSIQALVVRTGQRYRRWAASYLDRTAWQVVPLIDSTPPIAGEALRSAIDDLAPLVTPNGPPSR